MTTILTPRQLETARIYEAAVTIVALADTYSPEAMADVVTMLRHRPESHHVLEMADLIERVAKS